MVPTETPETPETPTDPNHPFTSALPSEAAAAHRVEAGRHGVIEAHELIHLLDNLEDERARGRFRESLYISVFVWVVIAWFIFYGPRVLWHQPRLKDAAATLHDRELTQLSLPARPRLPTPVMKNAPAPAPRPTIDNSTMERLREMSRKAAPAPQPETPQPAAPAPPPPPAAVSTPQPRKPPPIVADAPTAQPLKPNFGTPSSAGDAIRNALNDAAHSRGGTNVGGGSSRQSGPLNLGGAEVLSDMQGVDFGPYLRRILSDIKRNWDPLIPAEAQAPLYKQGESYIRFTILPDGSIKEASMHLDGSTHDEAINRSAWGSITSEGQFPPLPKNFHGPEFELRIHYLVNKNLPVE